MINGVGKSYIFTAFNIPTIIKGHINKGRIFCSYPDSTVKKSKTRSYRYIQERIYLYLENTTDFPLAVLIDADNIRPARIKARPEENSNFGSQPLIEFTETRLLRINLAVSPFYCLIPLHPSGNIVIPSKKMLQIRL